MATLSSIGITVGAGLGVFITTIGLFSVAVVKRNVFVAGRCVARPKDVIYNPDPSHPCQDRGRTPWGWFTWAMSLSYDTLLSGIPGTGTRDGGLRGHLLKVNLDGIVILRYHFLGLKVSAMGALLYLSVIMPMYSTARCSFLQDDLDTLECTNKTLTDYQQLTLANVRQLEPYEDEDNLFMSFFDVMNRQNMGRLYAVAVCTWLITWYAMKLLHMEWLDILAMRRVYYLEADHWKDRMEELDHIAEEQNRKDAARIEERSIWVPHPELRDTVPNIELYSILVGGLPSLPTDAMQDVEAVFSKKQSMDWQLSVTTAFFDHCVPNQPGFSSSVAAVTILPAATQITEAWQQWYNAAAKVRKLRYIRKRIKDVREKGGSDTEGSESGDVPPEEARKRQRKMRRRGSLHHDEVLGSQTDVEVEDHLFHALNLGPEQTAVYGREFALGAANFAPHGWFEWRINNAGLKELLVMENEAARDVQQANVELQEARDRIALKSSGDEDSELSFVSGDFKTSAVDPQPMTPPPPPLSDLAGLSTSVRSSANTTMQQEVFAPSLPEDAAVSSSVRSKRSISPSMSDSHRTPSTSMRSRKGLSKDDKQFSFGVNRPDSHDSPSRSSARSARSRLTRASMTQLPAALGLEAGLWTEQNELSKGSMQQKPRSHKTRVRQRDRGSGPPRRVMSVDLAGIVQEYDMDSTARSFNSDVAKMKSRQSDSSNQRDRTLVTRNSFDDDMLTSSRIERASLKRAVSTGTSDIDVGNVSTLRKNTLETGEEAWVKETTKDSKESSVSTRKRSSSSDFGSDRKGKGDMADSSSDLPISERKESLRARLSRNILNVDMREKTVRNKSNETKTAEPSKPLETVAPTTNRTHSENYDERDKQQNVAPTFGEEWANDGIEEVEETLEIAYNFEQRAGLRKRENGVSFSQAGNHSEKWGKVMSIVEETSKDMNGGNSRKRVIANGRWTLPSFKRVFGGITDRIFKWLKSWFTSPELLDDFARDSTYAVVTFTSRQAAVAARHCLADARGADRWVNLHDLPIPPLADAPVCSASCRGCARPVTLSISDTQKKIRRFVALVCLGIIYFFYTIPLTAVQNTVSAERLTELYPEISEAKETNPIMANIFLGLIPALIWILFFAICPPLFKIIANFGSTRSTSVKAENSALRYFWYFMVLAAFTGDSFQRAIINGFRDGKIRIGSEIQNLVKETARKIPVTVSSNWLNWIIARMFVVLPTQYLLQTNTFLFTWLGWNCCQRAVRGGGAGPPIPYRIYVDSGVVLLCLFALAPSSPLIAPAACLYFLLSLPLLRWTLIFLYKPKFDIGGGRFPFIFDVCVSGMLVGQILLFTMMMLKKATGPAIAAIMPFLPTIFYRFRLRTKYLGAFADAALLQTSLLDGWDNEDDASDEEREEFRKFLVDCHKAAYVPVCIASGDARTLITAEPAVVIPMDDPVEEESMVHNLPEDSTGSLPPPPPLGSMRRMPSYKTATVGARVPLTPRTARRTAFKPPPSIPRESLEEGTVPSLPGLPFQSGVMMQHPSNSLRNSRATESPESSPTNKRATVPSSDVVGRQAGLGTSRRSSGVRRASFTSSERSTLLANSIGSPVSGRRASFTTKRSVLQSPGASRILLSPKLQQSSQRGMMMRRMSRQPSRIATNNAVLPATPELPLTP